MFLQDTHEIFKAYNENRLAIFIGAGLSSDFNLPTWGKLSNNLLQKAKELNYLNDEICEYYAKMYDYKKIIGVVKQSFINNDDITSFYNLFKSELTLNDKTKEDLLNTKNYYSMLYNFFNKDEEGVHGLFLTTNADLCLDCFFKNGIVNKPEDLSNDFEQTISYHFRDEKLIHLHGSINDFDSLVFTQKEYNNRYSNEK